MNFQSITCKCLSGRFLVTLVAATVFLVTSLRGTLPTEDIKVILMVVITFYFTKHRKGEEATSHG